jgi:NAD(P)-dependent dehydrogenase (short-subunit alcohol dehydrogenase family)
MDPFEQKVAVVTGGSKGIGFGIARALVDRGVRVVVSARGQKDLDRAVRELGERAHGVRGDVGKPEDAARMMEEAVGRFGGLDILVNNAGIGIFDNAADLGIAQWRQVIDTNLNGVFYCCHAGIPHLRRRGGGWIINISSLAARHFFVRGSAYCASKAGLNAFTEVLMQEVRYDDIRVSCIMPGSVSTEFDPTMFGAGADWKLTPEDVGRVVVDLIAHDPRSLPSRVELRPSRPKK